MKKHGQAAALRHLIPGLFVAAMISLMVLMLGFGGLTLMAKSTTTLKWVSAWGTVISAVALMALTLTYGLAVGLVSLSISRGLGWRLLATMSTGSALLKVEEDGTLVWARTFDQPDRPGFTTLHPMADKDRIRLQQQRLFYRGGAVGL